jgi:SEC-C motif domain protein
MSSCPCCLTTAYESCCQPLIENQKAAQTPEQLMRSRYTAYSLARIDYIKQTMRDKPLLYFNQKEATQWAKKVSWLHLQVLSSSMEHQKRGFVEFIATYIEQNQLKIIHERSEFHLHHDRWFYVDGIHKDSPKQHPQIARNSSCPCGSGKKYKNCHEQ